MDTIDWADGFEYWAAVVNNNLGSRLPVNDEYNCAKHLL